MAFLLLLLVSLATLNRIETGAAGAARAEALARQNARLGLYIALGELQKYAGPDARVTGTADLIAGAKTENRHWTGVWRLTGPDNPGGAPELVRWLVSGEAVPETYEPPVTLDGKITATDSVVLVGSNSINLAIDEDSNGKPDQLVAVKKTGIPVQSSPGYSSPRINGHYAYWVGDEGVKASLGLTDVIFDQDSGWLPEFDSTELERIRQILPVRPGFENALISDNGDSILDPDADITRRDINKMLSRAQLALLPEVDSEAIRARFHDTTFLATGLLVNPATGMKWDLSLDPSPLGESFEAYMNYPSYMVRPGEDPNENFRTNAGDLRRRYKMVAPAGENSDGIAFSVAPVITDFYLLFSVNRAGNESINRGTAQSTTQILARYGLYVELWNPYTSALIPEDLELEITNLPTVILTTADGSTRAIDLQEVFGNTGGADPALSIILPFHELGFSGTDDQSWLPGRLYSWIGPNNFSNTEDTDVRTAKFYESQIWNSIWETPSGHQYPFPLSQRFGLRVDEPIAIQVKLKRLDGVNGPQVLANYSGFDIDGFEQPNISNTSDSRGWKFGYRFKIIESGDVAEEDAWEKSQWLRRGDPRNPWPAFGVNYFPPKGMDPTAYTTTGVREFEYLFDRTQGASGKNFMEDVPLFELPRQPHLSIGALQHLRITGRRPYSIGNSWGGAWNRIFDLFFFSGLQNGSFEPAIEDGYPIPNVRLAVSPLSSPVFPVLSDIQAYGGESAPNFRIVGAFNINSTSVPAWEAVLTSLRLTGWPYVNLDDREENNNGEQDTLRPTAEENLGQVFLRFSQSIQETYETGPKRHEIAAYQEHYNFGEEEPPTEYFRRGLKALREAGEPEGHSEYRQLARAIVSKILEKTRLSGPFTSIEEFLGPNPLFPDAEDTGSNLSLLEAAIEQVPSLNRDDANREIYHLTPNFLTQADVLTALAPILSVRSDTFLIRAYGDVVNPVSARVEGRAWCEALVQRVAEPVDPADDIMSPSPDGPGRRFKIINFRWLDSSDI